jgi:hypothetical protein
VGGLLLSHHMEIMLIIIPSAYRTVRVHGGLCASHCVMILWGFMCGSHGRKEVDGFKKRRFINLKERKPIRISIDGVVVSIDEEKDIIRAHF